VAARSDLRWARPAQGRRPAQGSCGEPGWRSEPARGPEQAWRLEPEWRVVRAWRPEQELGSERESGSAREWPVLALSAVAVRRGSWRVVEPAPFSVALVPARFPFPAPVVSQVQPELWVEQAARPPAEQDARAPALAGTVAAGPQAAEHAGVAPPQVGEREAPGPQAEARAGLRGEAAVAPVVAEAVAAVPGAEVRRLEAPGAPVALPWGAPWKVAPPWPGLRPRARSARAMERRPVAAP
jgi:hypothetical protein